MVWRDPPSWTSHCSREGGRWEGPVPAHGSTAKPYGPEHSISRGRGSFFLKAASHSHFQKFLLENVRKTQKYKERKESINFLPPNVFRTFKLRIVHMHTDFLNRNLFYKTKHFLPAQSSWPLPPNWKRINISVSFTIAQPILVCWSFFQELVLLFNPYRSQCLFLKNNDILLIRV